jgi:hypothetical protein
MQARKIKSPTGDAANGDDKLSGIAQNNDIGDDPPSTGDGIVGDDPPSTGDGIVSSVVDAANTDDGPASPDGMETSATLADSPHIL